MADTGDYLKTIAIYCGDIIENGERYRDLVPLMERIEILTGEIVTGADQSAGTLTRYGHELESLLGTAAMKLLGIYSRNPDDLVAENLYNRATSVHEMCCNYLAERGKGSE